MLNILIEYNYIFILILGFIILFLFERQQAISVLYALMLQAKRMAKDAILETGKEQEDWVVEKAKLVLPRWILIFLPDDKLRGFVKFLFDKLKDYADDGQFNNSIKGGESE